MSKWVTFPHIFPSFLSLLLHASDLQHLYAVFRFTLHIKDTLFLLCSLRFRGQYLYPANWSSYMPSRSNAFNVACWCDRFSFSDIPAAKSLMRWGIRISGGMTLIWIGPANWIELGSASEEPRMVSAFRFRVWEEEPDSAQTSIATSMFASSYLEIRNIRITALAFILGPLGLTMGVEPNINIHGVRRRELLHLWE